MARKSKTALYRFEGPTTGLLLEGGEEVLLYHNCRRELPTDHPHVQRLVANKYLIEIQEG